MKSRCSNPRHRGYPNYGGRGIRVSNEWRESFERFYINMGPRPSDAHSLDRIDNEGGYSAWNCRWAVASTQQNNRRINNRLTHGGRTMTVTEWADDVGIPVGTLQARLRKGWAVSDVLTKSVRIYTRATQA